MTFKPSFELRDICGEKVLIATGAEHIDFNRLIHLNETACDIYTHFADKAFTLSEVVDFVEQHYEGASRQQIEADVEHLFESFRESGVLA